MSHKSGQLLCAVMSILKRQLARLEFSILGQSILARWLILTMGWFPILLVSRRYQDEERKMKQLVIAISLILISPASLVWAEEGHEMPPVYSGSPAFEKIKSLEGTWVGSVRHEGGPQEGKGDKATVSYRVTSNGSAVIETIMEGTPMEMTSVYYDLDGKLTMTHYCAVANRPVMSLVENTDKKIKLSFVGGQQLDVEKDMHIHGLELEIEGKDKIVQRWQGYDKGKATHLTVVELQRSPT